MQSYVGVKEKLHFFIGTAIIWPRPKGIANIIAATKSFLYLHLSVCRLPVFSSLAFLFSSYFFRVLLIALVPGPSARPLVYVIKLVIFLGGLSQ